MSSVFRVQRLTAVDADLLAEDNAQLRDLSSALPSLQAVGATLRVQVSPFLTVGRSRWRFPCAAFAARFRCTCIFACLDGEHSFVALRSVLQNNAALTALAIPSLRNCTYLTIAVRPFGFCLLIMLLVSSVHALRRISRAINGFVSSVRARGVILFLPVYPSLRAERRAADAERPEPAHAHQADSDAEIRAPGLCAADDCAQPRRLADPDYGESVALLRDPSSRPPSHSHTASLVRLVRVPDWRSSSFPSTLVQRCFRSTCSTQECHNLTRLDGFAPALKSVFSSIVFSVGCPLLMSVLAAAVAVFALLLIIRVRVSACSLSRCCHASRARFALVALTSTPFATSTEQSAAGDGGGVCTAEQHVPGADHGQPEPRGE